MIITRQWSMPNKNTFSIKCIKELIDKYFDTNSISIDPFANSNKMAKITNDLDPQYNTDYHMDALEFLKIFDKDSVDIVLYDPPYSVRQVSECYRKMNMAVNMETTQSSFWSNLKKEISRIVKKDGIVMSFGWNSGGIGKTNGFEIVEILLVAHGGPHNDTICVIERKVEQK